MGMPATDRSMSSPRSRCQNRSVRFPFRRDFAGKRCRGGRLILTLAFGWPQEGGLRSKTQRQKFVAKKPCVERYFRMRSMNSCCAGKHGLGWLRKTEMGILPRIFPIFQTGLPGVSHLRNNSSDSQKCSHQPRFVWLVTRLASCIQARPVQTRHEMASGLSKGAVYATGLIYESQEKPDVLGTK